MNFFQWIVDLYNALTPFVVVYSYQRGVRWTLGGNPRELGPGLHLKLWPIWDIEVIPVVDDYIELPIQSVITKDGKLVCFSTAIGFRIVDAVKHFCEVEDFKEAIAALSMAHLAKRVRETNYDDVSSDLKRLEDSLEGTLTTRVKPWGSEIVMVGFINFALVPRQFRIFGGFNAGG